MVSLFEMEHTEFMSTTRKQLFLKGFMIGRVPTRQAYKYRCSELFIFNTRKEVSSFSINFGASKSYPGHEKAG